MPNELIIVGTAILVLTYGVICYLAGKGDLLNVIVLMLQDKTKELENKMKESENYETENKT